MSDQTRGPSDATDDSSTKAAETQIDAEEQHTYPSDPRLHPGGSHGAPVDPGMSSLDREIPPGHAENPHLQDIGSTRNMKS